MEHILTDCAPDCDHTLTVESLASHWEKSWSHGELVLSHVEKVLPRYEQAKSCMSRQSVHELYLYLKTSRWISVADRPSYHQAYKYFRGLSPNRPNQPLRYYPYYFIMQALFPNSEAVKKMCFDMEHHWGVTLDFTQPFYPRLDDAEQERKLIMGHIQPKDESVSFNSPLPTSYSGLSTGQSISGPSESNQESSDTLPTTDDQAADSSNMNFFHDYEERLSDSKRDLDEAREKTKEVHHHLVQSRNCKEQAQAYAERASEHERAATEMVKSLIESLGSTNKRSARDSSGGARRSSKRLREK
ncbi:hypothetical protein FSST1_005527 [Fusarium sambucinum]